MCYSQYRSLEGIELLSQVLFNNGYIPYTNQPESVRIEIGMRVRYQYAKNIWKTGLVIVKGKNPKTNEIVYRLDNQENPKAVYTRSQIYPCQYGLWTGEEDVASRRVILDAFNNDNNKYGQRCLIIMITQAGAEGISLFNVRQVHILEPYWNNIRIRQVIGRARRIRSHINLPEDQQNVTVFKYDIKFAQHHKQDPKQQNITWLKDLIEKVGFDNIKPLFSRLYNVNELSETFLSDINQTTQNAINKDDLLTADEILTKISLEKDKIYEHFTNIMKQTSIDCEFNKDDNIKSDPSLSDLECYQNITNMQTDPYMYNYKQGYTMLTQPSTSTALTIAPPITQLIDIDFPFKNPVDNTKIVNLTVTSSLGANQSIPSTFKDKLAFIKPDMNVYKFDKTLKSIIDKDKPIGKTIEVTKSDGTKAISVKFTDDYKNSLK